MIFGVGESVLIDVPHPPNMYNHIIPPGTIGLVQYRREISGTVPYCIYVIIYTDGQGVIQHGMEFYDKDLKPLPYTGPLLFPEMDLEEIEKAEEIMEELK